MYEDLRTKINVQLDNTARNLSYFYESVLVSLDARRTLKCIKT